MKSVIEQVSIETTVEVVSNKTIELNREKSLEDYSEFVS